MNTTAKQHSEWRTYLSPWKITLLAINGVCFGACVALLASGSERGPLVLLTVGTGLSFFSGLVGAILAARQRNNQ